MLETKNSFHSRLKALGRKHAAMSNGVTTYMRADGLLVVRPRRVPRRGFPVRGMVYILAGFFSFKGFLLASMGPITYQERVEALAAGTMIEQAGAVVMMLDPMTQSIAEMIGPILR